MVCADRVRGSRQDRLVGFVLRDAPRTLTATPWSCAHPRCRRRGSHDARSGVFQIILFGTRQAMRTQDCALARHGGTERPHLIRADYAP
jgi:hypothetical protein